LVRGRKGEYKSVFEDMRRAGYVRVRVDGEVRDLSENIELDKYKQHTIEVVIDRLVIRHPRLEAADADSSTHGNGLQATSASPERAAVHAAGGEVLRVAERPTAYVPERADAAPPADPEASQRSRVADSVETTLKLGNGILLVSIIGGEERL